MEKAPEILDTWFSAEAILRECIDTTPLKLSLQSEQDFHILLSKYIHRLSVRILLPSTSRLNTTCFCENWYNEDEGYRKEIDQLHAQAQSINDSLWNETIKFHRNKFKK